MAHIYHGKDTLILTDVQKQDFPSGLSRIDATYKCRTTEADNLAPLLAAGNRLPEFPAYIIRQNPTRNTGQDGFTTFRSSSFSSTGTGISQSSPAVFGAVSNVVTINVKLFGQFVNPNFPIFPFTFTLLSDTITRTFTLPSNVSVTTLALPSETLSYKILPPLSSPFSFSVISAENASLNKILLNVAIVNVNRQTFGGIDEVQITWGISVNGQTFSIVV